MTAIETLEFLVKDWPGAMARPDVARTVLFCESTFPDFYGKLIREIHLHSGDWRAAVSFILEHTHNLPRERVLKFADWAEKLQPTETNQGAAYWWQKGGAA
jgi:hypothetical protein